MNVYYAKTILYSYKSLQALMEQMDDLVEKKALTSMSNLTPCEIQCQNILSITAQKDVLINLYLSVEQVLKEFSDKQLDYFDYKYFKQKSKEYYKDFDSTGRTYFRIQKKLAESFAYKMEKVGISEEWVIENCMCMDFFKGVYKNVLEREKSTSTKRI